MKLEQRIKQYPWLELTYFEGGWWGLVKMWKKNFLNFLLNMFLRNKFHENKLEIFCQFFFWKIRRKSRVCNSGRCDIWNWSLKKSGQILQVFFLNIFQSLRGFSDIFVLYHDSILRRKKFFWEDFFFRMKNLRNELKKIFSKSFR